MSPIWATGLPASWLYFTGVWYLLATICLSDLTAIGGSKDHGASLEGPAVGMEEARVLGTWAQRGSNPRDDKAASEETSGSARLFVKYCLKCHGEGGKGTDETKKGEKVPDFTNAMWHERRNDSQLHVSIRDGRGRSMPAFGDHLNEEEIGKLVAQVRTFAGKNAPRKKSTDAIFDARFQELEEEWRKLRREFWNLHESKDPKERGRPEKIPE